MELDVLSHDGPHPHSEGGDVVAIKYVAVAFPDTAIEAFGDGMLHIQLAAWEEVLSRLVKQEAQRPEIHQARRVMGEVEKLDVAAVVNTELQSLRHIVDLGGDDGLRSVELKLRQHLKQSHAFLELFRRLVVDAINLDHGYMLVFVIILSLGFARG